MTFGAPLQSVSFGIVVGGIIAVPACLMMMWLTMEGDCPFRSPAVIAKCFVVWLIANLVGYPLGLLGPVTGLICHSLLVAALLDRVFDQGFWRCAWCAYGTYAILGLALLAGQVVLGRSGLGIV